MFHKFYFILEFLLQRDLKCYTFGATRRSNFIYNLENFKQLQTDQKSKSKNTTYIYDHQRAEAQRDKYKFGFG